MGSGDGLGWPWSIHRHPATHHLSHSLEERLPPRHCGCASKQQGSCPLRVHTARLLSLRVRTAQSLQGLSAALRRLQPEPGHPPKLHIQCSTFKSEASALLFCGTGTYGEGWIVGPRSLWCAGLRLNTLQSCKSVIHPASLEVIMLPCSSGVQAHPGGAGCWGPGLCGVSPGGEHRVIQATGGQGGTGRILPGLTCMDNLQNTAQTVRCRLGTQQGASPMRRPLSRTALLPLAPSSKAWQMGGWSIVPRMPDHLGGLQGHVLCQLLYGKCKFPDHGIG